MREVDQAAQRKDEREAERDQQVIRADQQAVQDLLEDLDQDHGARGCTHPKPLPPSGRGSVDRPILAGRLPLVKGFRSAARRGIG